MRWQNSPGEAAHSPSSLRGCHSAVCGERGSQTLVSSLGRGGTPHLPSICCQSGAECNTVPTLLSHFICNTPIIFVC